MPVTVTSPVEVVLFPISAFRVTTDPKIALPIPSNAPSNIPPLNVMV